MTAQSINLEKPLPSSTESERVLLGAILLDNALIASAVETLIPDDFYSPLHQRVFRAMIRLFERGEKIDPILINEEFKKDGTINVIGETSTITNLTYGLPQFSHIDDYIKIVADKKNVRNVIRATSQINHFAFNESENAETVMNFAESTIFNVCNVPSGSKPESISTLAFASVEETMSLIERGVKVTGLTSGFADIDEKTGGWKKTDLIIVAARPSMGKSAIVAEFASNAAADGQSVVAFFSLEMSKAQLTARLICSEARIDLHRYLNGNLYRDEIQKAQNAARVLAKKKILIDDTPGIAPIQMLAKSRRIHNEHKRLDLIVVDYMQLMTSSKRAESRQQEVSQISRELKQIAKELNVPVIALSQLSRAPEARNPPRPMMSDLRESGSIEQDADVVTFIYREEYYKPTEENAGVAEFLISKQRNGPTGSVNLAFLKEFTRFEDFYDGSKPGNYSFSVPRSGPSAKDDPRFN